MSNFILCENRDKEEDITNEPDIKGDARIHAFMDYGLIASHSKENPGCSIDNCCYLRILTKHVIELVRGAADE
jgi:hypothetical protein